MAGVTYNDFPDRPETPPVSNFLKDNFYLPLESLGGHSDPEDLTDCSSLSDDSDDEKLKLIDILGDDSQSGSEDMFSLQGLTKVCKPEILLERDNSPLGSGSEVSFSLEGLMEVCIPGPLPEPDSSPLGEHGSGLLPESDSGPLSEYGSGLLPEPNRSPKTGDGRALAQPDVKASSKPKRELLSWYTQSPSGTVTVEAQPDPRRTTRNPRRYATEHANKRRRITDTAQRPREPPSDSTTSSQTSMQPSFLSSTPASVVQAGHGPLKVIGDYGRIVPELVDDPHPARHDESTVPVGENQNGPSVKQLANRDKSRSDDGLDSPTREAVGKPSLYQKGPPLSVNDQQKDDDITRTQAPSCQQPGLLNPSTSSSGLASRSIFAAPARLSYSLHTLRAGVHKLAPFGWTVSSNLAGSPYPSPFAIDSVFLSQIIPKHYQSKQRDDILGILTSRDYIPRCVSSITTLTPEAFESLQRKNMAANRIFEAPLGPSGVGWPPGKIPLEIFQHIGRHLPRDAKANMRLVNAEFEQKISDSFFEKAVVPFRTGVFDTDYSGANLPHDGMRVFKNWGGSIRKFALSFEVDEDSLLGLTKNNGETTTDTYYGPQRWYTAGYPRFTAAAKFEMTADEERKMTTAFSKLTGLRELGLSIISSQGWLRGADRSDRAVIFSSKPVVFGPSALPDKALRDSMNRWEHIMDIEKQMTISTYNPNKAKRCYFETRAITLNEEFGEPLVYFEPQQYVCRRQNTPIMFNGVNYEARMHDDVKREESIYMGCKLEKNRPQGSTNPDERSAEERPPTVEETSPFPEHVIPNALTQLQFEWLMEMEWAQTAFLRSWTTSILNNPNVFESLKALNVANLSSKYIAALKRHDLWGAFPNLRNLTILIAPDWHRVGIEGADKVEGGLIHPSIAYEDFTQLLTFLFGGAKPAIKTLDSLKVGYVGGGEHATGIFARNRNILPAPVLENPADVDAPKTLNPLSQKDSLTFTQIRHLHFTNCWFTPHAMRAFFKKLKTHSKVLETITLDSVSLCAQEPSTLTKTEMRALAKLTYNQRKLSWMTHDPIPGLWSDVLSSITPGHGLQYARIQKRFAADYPNNHPNTNTKFRQITFKSCGYVRLVYNLFGEFDQTTVAQVVRELPECLT
ncbi:MAG: hypothetical protein Q9174_003038, partial [Haloplaca sp. 1 TL-2023]